MRASTYEAGMLLKAKTVTYFFCYFFFFFTQCISYIRSQLGKPIVAKGRKLLCDEGGGRGTAL